MKTVPLLLIGQAAVPTYAHCQIARDHGIRNIGLLKSTLYRIIIDLALAPWSLSKSAGVAEYRGIRLTWRPSKHCQCRQGASAASVSLLEASKFLVVSLVATLVSRAFVSTNGYLLVETMLAHGSPGHSNEPLHLSC